MSFWGFLGKTKTMRRCARERGVEEVQKSGGGVPYGVRIDDEGRRGLQTLAINFAGLAASRAGGEKGDWRRGVRASYRSGAGKKRPGFKA
jgi:hypothetical protein